MKCQNIHLKTDICCLDVVLVQKSLSTVQVKVALGKVCGTA